MSNDRQELIRRFAVAIVQGLHAQPNDGRINWVRVWEEATTMADAEPPQPALVTAQELEHTREDWWELQGDVTRLEKDVQRLSGTVETLEGRIRRAAALLRGTPRYDTACGFVVPEDRIDEVVQILEGQE
jgi:hypothetical protein